ncbi:hypothetical protein [Pseudomonas putida]|uniref:Uncharacterized protein n=1 Tax=Pseudomonas putida TaxID=303 RepID=A0A8I1JGT4_PSEPU|nr:hypothetical protein [Pseudomonas putida]MBI6883132.1 hypothetical protein [Pseudomonas putida]
MELKLIKPEAQTQAAASDAWEPSQAGERWCRKVFSGIEMIAKPADVGALWKLSYAGYELTGFASLADAMNGGAKFAEDVFALLKEPFNAGEAVVSCDPLSDLEKLLDQSGAFPDVLGRMKALVGMAKEETEALREGVEACNPEKQLAREAELLDRIGQLTAQLQEAKSGKA